jgi:hypothetical protein
VVGAQWNMIPYFILSLVEEYTTRNILVRRNA